MRHIRFSPWFVLATLLLVGCSEPARPTINLYRAIHAGDLDQIKRHLYWGTDVNQPDPHGELALHVAARRSRVVIARELLKHGANVNGENRQGQTPLHVALVNGKTQVAGVLVDNGAADDPQALLFGLVGEGVDDRDSLDFLIKRGADVDARNDAGASPLHLAVSEGHLLLAKRLIDQGADVNLPDGTGRTPLAMATSNDDRDIVTLLERFGARLEPPDAPQ
ncbi:MAG: ankyrin repeat domain-containing protein [Pseudomonadota bacterium]|nr:ankyrin repeat domain-containing protein [Pseudomonadota bacterium]